MKLNLGSGNNYRQDYENIDCNVNVKADIYLDLSKDCLPFPDESVDEILCKSILEHTSNLEHLFSEMFRVLNKSGKIRIYADNSSFILYHFPRKKAYHDTYNIENTNSRVDRHFYFFQMGHLKAISELVGFKIRKLFYINPYLEGKNKIVQNVMGKIFGKKFGYCQFYMELGK